MAVVGKRAGHGTGACRSPPPLLLQHADAPQGSLKRPCFLGMVHAPCSQRGILCSCTRHPAHAWFRPAPSAQSWDVEHCTCNAASAQPACMHYLHGLLPLPPLARAETPLGPVRSADSGDGPSWLTQVQFLRSALARLRTAKHHCHMQVLGSFLAGGRPRTRRCAGPACTRAPMCLVLARSCDSTTFPAQQAAGSKARRAGLGAPAVYGCMGCIQQCGMVRVCASCTCIRA